MNFFEFIQTRIFVRHFIVSVILTVLIVSLVLWALKWYTHHGESIAVPSLVGLTPDQISQLETISDFEVIIVDSVYDSKMPKGSVIIQDPLPGSNVKRHRKIYLTTVAVMPEKVSMPDLVDLSLRQATATLETYGLKLGNISYVPDIAANAVLGQYYLGSSIEPGFEILKGSVIELKVGQSIGGARFQVPFLIGKTRQEALQMLESRYLAPGEEVFEDDADPENARVYTQTPSYVKGLLMNAGQTVSLVFRDPDKFDFDAYLQTMGADTLEVVNDSIF
ncbi:PASTA domain-containing protein [Lentimicrobium sp.]|uniref:PASTA domain-containing protein n=1 Tax=Lentimicrobium sp. TaxID=2034841 RepID=UPI002CD4679F|nr:PASTA domain-containing protein [Lentimicrobium sp.]HPJ62021.1 PASTA domain-containing protein [Lentimicrobium sp.]HPR25112.1 PASTA domain-containing protein [Lentimicrobium sp.]